MIESEIMTIAPCPDCEVALGWSQVPLRAGCRVSAALLLVACAWETRLPSDVREISTLALCTEYSVHALHAASGTWGRAWKERYRSSCRNAVAVVAMAASGSNILFWTADWSLRLPVRRNGCNGVKTKYVISRPSLCTYGVLPTPQQTTRDLAAGWLGRRRRRLRSPASKLNLVPLVTADLHKPRDQNKSPNISLAPPAFFCSLRSTCLLLYRYSTSSSPILPCQLPCSVSFSRSDNRCPTSTKAAVWFPCCCRIGR